MHIKGIYAHIYATYKINDINHSTRSMVKILDISEQIWLPHSKYSLIGHMVNRHINPTFLHMFTKTQPTTISNTHVTAKYMPETNIPT